MGHNFPRRYGFRRGLGRGSRKLGDGKSRRRELVKNAATLHNAPQPSQHFRGVEELTPYHETFLPILLLGCLIAGTLSLVAATRSGCLLPGFLLLVGVLVFWVALFIGADMGYRAWQSMPDPPEEAFSDASAVGALLMGWVPGGVFCLLVYVVVRGMRWLAHWANPDGNSPTAADPPEAAPAESQTTDSGNPYQSPRG